MLILEKEISSKNNRIYELEMTSLKQNRSKPSLVLGRSYEDRTKITRPNRNEGNSKSDRSQSSLKSISLK